MNRIKSKFRVMRINLLRKLGLIKKDELFISDKEFHNPIDNNLYVSEDGFRTYLNGKEVPQKSESLKETKLEKVILLNTDEEIAEAVFSIKDFSKIIETGESIFNELFLNSMKAGKIMVQFELLPIAENIIQFAVKDDIDLEIMAEFEKRINSEAYPKPQKNSITLQILFKVNSFDE